MSKVPNFQLSVCPSCLTRSVMKSTASNKHTYLAKHDANCTQTWHHLVNKQHTQGGIPQPSSAADLNHNHP
jgi:hypothetical protein